MATRFEIAMHGGNALSLRAAGDEALDEIERIESRISPYRPDSEVARVNRLAHREDVRVSPLVFDLLEQAARLTIETGGLFDITVGPLMRCWGLMRGSGRVPGAEEVAQARALVGMSKVHLDAARLTVRFEREGMMLDLGALGKGYAVEKAVSILKDAGVTCALIHGGTSTIHALGQPPGQDAWKVSLQLPAPAPFHPLQSAPACQPGLDRLLAVVSLRDESLSISARWGKSFQAAGITYGHVLDPSTGNPANGALMAALVLPSATESDALSTALLVWGEHGDSALAATRPLSRSFVVWEESGEIRFQGRGVDPVRKQ